MAKPILVAETQWTTSQVPGTNLLTNSVGTDLLSKSLWVEKLKGFNFIRATAVYRVVVNATPFHAGNLKFGFIPLQGTSVTLPSAQPSWRNYNLATFSTVPGVHIDARDSTAIVRIPYVTTVDYYTLETNDGIDWGSWFLKVYSRLSTGTAPASVGVSVYLHFEDVELAVPLHPQMSSGKRTSSKNFMAKVGSAAKAEIVSKEAEIMANKGIVSSGLLYAGKAVDCLAHVPMLSAIATPAAWCLRGAATVASWFGFSKPQVESYVQYISRNNQPYMANATGIDTSVSLSLFHDNAISMRPGFGATDLDEMNFDYIKTIPGYIRSFEWENDDMASSVIASFIMQPDILCASESVGIFDGNFYPPFGYFTSFFTAYRGSIDMHFKFVKTDFHSGKLSFSFVPAGSYTTPNSDQQAYLLREIVDIKDKSEVVLRIPYLQYQKYIDTAESLGTLYVTVVNELVSPDTAASSIDIIVYCSAGDDFEYAMPGKNPKNPSYDPILPQMGGVELDVDQNVVSEVIGNYPSMPNTLEASSSTIGEKFVSIKQLLLRYTRPASNKIPVIYGATLTAFYYPWDVSLPTTSLFEPTLSFDAMSRLAHGYAFMRGSVRLGLRASNVSSRIAALNSTSLSEDSSTVFSTALSYSTYSGATYDTGFASRTGHANADTFFDSGIGMPSVRIPYYCENHSTAILPKITTAVPADTWDPYGGALFSDSSATSGTTVVDLRRSVGEDFAFGYFLGFPPLMIRIA